MAMILMKILSVMAMIICNADTIRKNDDFDDDAISDDDDDYAVREDDNFDDVHHKPDPLSIFKRLGHYSIDERVE